MPRKHEEINSWMGDEFPLDYDDDEQMDAVHEILPAGYWLGEDRSEEERCIVLMQLDE